MVRRSRYDVLLMDLMQAHRDALHERLNAIDTSVKLVAPPGRGEEQGAERRTNSGRRPGRCCSRWPPLALAVAERFPECSVMPVPV